MKHTKKILFGLCLAMLAINLTAQEVKTEKKKVKKQVSEETQETVAQAKSIEFQEPPFAMAVQNESKANTAGIFNAYSLEILNADQKVVEKAWKDLMKDYKGKTKMNRKEAELSTTNARITELGSATYNVKASIEQRGGNVVVHSWYEGADGYVDENLETEHTGINTILQDFAIKVRQEMVKIELDEEEKVLKDVESTLNKLKRQNDSYHRDIEVAKRKIAEAEQNILENEAAQEEAVAKIDGQRGIVEAVRQRLKRIQ